MTFPFGVTVYRDRLPQTANPYNPGSTVQGDWAHATTITIPGAWVASSSSTAQTDATRTEVLVAKSLFCPPVADVRIGDRIRAGGEMYYVNELPTADTNPFTGWQPVREVPLDATLG